MSTLSRSLECVLMNTNNNIVLTYADTREGGCGLNHHLINTRLRIPRCQALEESDSKVTNVRPSVCLQFYFQFESYGLVVSTKF